MPPTPTYDLCVYGDSPSAIAAATQGGRMGVRTVLTVPGNHVGGILVNGLGSNDLDNHNFKNSVAVGGIAREFYQRIADFYGGGLGYRFEPHVAESIFLSLLEEAGVDILFDRRLRENGGVTMHQHRITAIHFENGASILARQFIDGTVEGDLMAFAGVRYTYGREGNAAYDETLNGVVHHSNYRQFTVKVDPYIEAGNPDSGLIASVQAEPLAENGSGDRASMAFCFRICLTCNSQIRIPIPQPDNYQAEQYEIYRRYFAAGAGDNFFAPDARIPNQKSDIGSWHDLSANHYGYSHGWPDGNYAERESIYQRHRDFTIGLIWFLQNDPSVPICIRQKWANWGLPADEFQDNGHWPHQLYVRNGRRMLSDWIITEADLTQGNPKVAEDPVALAFWPPDMHHARRIVKDGQVWNEGFVFGSDIQWRPFGISYRAIRPKANECTNLLVPSALSSSYVGYGAVRLEWTFMVLGQSAATAAVIALRTKDTVQNISYEQLREQLLVDGQILENIQTE